jgi:long-chain acyl-CoA synthetase
MALNHAGCIPVSLYQTMPPEQLAYIVNHSQAVVMLVENPTALQRLLPVREQMPQLRHIVLVDGSTSDAGVLTWSEVVSAGREFRRSHPEAFERATKSVRPNDLLTLMYTSGTTGVPKGVMASHRQILWLLEARQRREKIRSGDRLISYLPLAHSAERFFAYWQAVVVGLETCFCPDMSSLSQSLIEVRPEFFFGPPRVWEKLYAAMQSWLATDPAANTDAMKEALGDSRRVVDGRQSGTVSTSAMASELRRLEPELHKVRASVGLDRCRLAVSAAAPLSTELACFFHSVGLRLTEVWGMTELAGPGTWSAMEELEVGSVGKPLPGVEVRLDDDGELLIRGGHTMPGYYKMDEETAATLLDSGWMRTGDVAEITARGSVRIIDRKKELIITSTGKNIAPAPMENRLKQSRFISQACVVGDKRPYATALLVPEFQMLADWGRERGLTGTPRELAMHEEVIAELQRAVAEVNAHVSRAEQIKHFAVLPIEWTVESDELTPSLKMKRRVVTARHADVIEAMYRKPPGRSGSRREALPEGEALLAGATG